MAVPLLQNLTTSQLSDWASLAIAAAADGQVAQRIPLLAKADPRWFAVQIHVGTAKVETNHSDSYQAHQFGAIDRPFPLMSAVKPFLLLYLLEQFGFNTVSNWVGVMPSEQSFNSLRQLITDHGRPRNPMINSGAMTLASRLPGNTGSDRCQAFCDWLNAQAGCHLVLDKAMLASVRSAGREPNQEIVRHLTDSHQLTNPEITLDTYEQICCLSGRVADLACLGNLLTFEQDSITSQHRRIVNAIMLTCGLYEASPVYAIKIGLPMKSGISGTLIAIIPKQGTIACYSPALDTVGNPIAGLVFVEQLANALQLSLFG
jgi:glutaminase